MLIAVPIVVWDEVGVSGEEGLLGVLKVEVEFTRLSKGVSAWFPGLRLRGVTTDTGKIFEEVDGARASGSGLS